MAKESKTKKTLCPECETECTVEIDADGDYTGSCENCGLNVGRVLTQRRYREALRRADEMDEREKNKGKKKPDPFA
jgi:hypothetical protein